MRRRGWRREADTAMALAEAQDRIAYLERKRSDLDGVIIELSKRLKWYIGDRHDWLVEKDRLLAKLDTATDRLFQAGLPVEEEWGE
jgi:hypothetical protein